MKKEYKKFLPIGSVVMLKNGKKRLMVTGYASIDIAKADKLYDYCGCMFPEGVINTSNTLLFNHENIDQVFCLGYSDEEQNKYVENLNNILTDENIEKMLKRAQSNLKVMEEL